MQFTFKICRLSHKFYTVMPSKNYPEIMTDLQRPYFVMQTQKLPNLYICVPFRTNVYHKECYKLPIVIPNTSPAIDYSKTLLIENDAYVGEQVLINKMQYKALRSHVVTVATEIIRYIERYKSFLENPRLLQTSAYRKRYQYTTLKYFSHFLIK